MAAPVTQEVCQEKITQDVCEEEEAIQAAGGSLALVAVPKVCAWRGMLACRTGWHLLRAACPCGARPSWPSRASSSALWLSAEPLCPPLPCATQGTTLRQPKVAKHLTHAEARRRYGLGLCFACGQPCKEGHVCQVGGAGAGRSACEWAGQAVV